MFIKHAQVFATTPSPIRILPSEDVQELLRERLSGVLKGRRVDRRASLFVLVIGIGIVWGRGSRRVRVTQHVLPYFPALK